MAVMAMNSAAAANKPMRAAEMCMAKAATISQSAAAPKMIASALEEWTSSATRSLCCKGTPRRGTTESRMMATTATMKTFISHAMLKKLPERLYSMTAAEARYKTASMMWNMASTPQAEASGLRIRAKRTVPTSTTNAVTPRMNHMEVSRGAQPLGWPLLSKCVAMRTGKRFHASAY